MSIQLVKYNDSERESKQLSLWRSCSERLSLLGQAVFHDHNYTAYRVSTSKSEAVLATSPWLIDQLMAPTSFSTLQWTMSPGMHVSEAISWPSAESAWLIYLGSFPAPCWAPYSYPHILTLFLPVQWIPEGLLTSPAALMEQSAWTWGCVPEHVDWRVLESMAWRLNLFSAPSPAECWVTPVEFLQYLYAVFSTIYSWGAMICLAIQALSYLR